MEAVIKVEGLTKQFDKLTAVDNITFQIGQGEVFGLLGPNGAGKTTTLHMLATLIKPGGGIGVVNGFDIVKQPGKVRQSIGMVFQDPSSDDILTGYENLKLNAMMYGVPRDIIESRINQVLELVDLVDRKNDLVKKYSGGMRRRLEIARGLLHNPKILLLDEPTLGLDPQTREHIWVYIEKLVKEQNVTVIITTHYMDEADRLCDRIAIIDFGKIVVMDSPEKLKKVLGGDIIKISMKNPDPEKVKALDYVKNAKVVDKSLVLTVVDAGKHVQQILKVVGEVDSVEMRSPTLNDVFLHYTGREFRGETPEGGVADRIMNYMSRR